MSGDSIPLIFNKLPKSESLLIGRFDHPISLNAAREHPLLMYEDLEEEIKDDESEIIEKNSEYYQRRRRKRFKRKSQLVIENSVKKNKSEPAVNVRGMPIEPKSEGGNTSRYVLMQVMKKVNIDNNVTQTEVNIIPVDDWYRFQKADRTKAVSLDQIDIEYEHQEKLKKIAQSKYKRISKAMEQNAKVFGETIAPKINTSTNKDSTDNEVSSSFGLQNLKMKSIPKSNFKGHMNDGGEDFDAEKEFVEICGFEYEETRSDDEEDIHQEQKDIIDKMDREEIIITNEDDEANADDSDEENEEDSDHDDGEEPNELVIASKQLGDFLQKQTAIKNQELEQDEERNDNISIASGETDIISGDRKRSREEDITSTATSIKKIKPEGDTTASSVGDLQPQQQQPKKYELTEEAVKSYVTLMGGRIKTKNLAKIFNVSSLGESGKEKFKMIASKLMRVIEDPLHGKLLELKQQSQK